MTKAQKEKQEREQLKKLLQENPKVVEIVDNMLKAENLDVKDAVAGAISAQLSKYRMIGTQIGWVGAHLAMYSKVKDMADAQEIKELIKENADKFRKQFGLSDSYFDDNGEIIVDNEE